jgi:IS30 family transposase
MLKHKYKSKHTQLDYYRMLYIRSTLYNEHYSPELISVTGKALLGKCVSHETIYKWIWDCKRLASDEDKHRYISTSVMAAGSENEGITDVKEVSPLKKERLLMSGRK